MQRAGMRRIEIHGGHRITGMKPHQTRERKLSATKAACGIS
jgi:hypothetical protein